MKLYAGSYPNKNEAEEVAKIANNLVSAIIGFRSTDPTGAEDFVVEEEGSGFKVVPKTPLANVLVIAEPSVITAVAQFIRCNLGITADRYRQDYVSGATVMIQALQAVVRAAVGSGSVMVDGEPWNIKDYKFPFSLAPFEDRGRLMLSAMVDGMDDIREAANVPDTMKVTPDQLLAKVQAMCSAARKSSAADKQYFLDYSKTRTIQTFSGTNVYYSAGKFYGKVAYDTDLIWATPVSVDLSIFGESTKDVAAYVRGLKLMAIQKSAED